MQRKLCKKYFKLFFGELIATILFAFIWIEFIYIVEWGAIYLTSPYTISGFLVLIYLILSQSDYLYWYIFLYLFAAAEFINYYYYRLSYQTLSELKELFFLIRKRKLKPSKLANELNR